MAPVPEGADSEDPTNSQQETPLGPTDLWRRRRGRAVVMVSVALAVTALILFFGVRRGDDSRAHVSAPTGTAPSEPTLALDRDSARPGERVGFTGVGFTDPRLARQGDEILFLLSRQTQACEFVVGGGAVDVDFDLGAGTVTGSFQVGTTGGCTQTRVPEVSTDQIDGVYEVSFGCHACYVAKLRVVM